MASTVAPGGGSGVDRNRGGLCGRRVGVNQQGEQLAHLWQDFGQLQFFSQPCSLPDTSQDWHKEAATARYKFMNYSPLRRKTTC